MKRLDELTAWELETVMEADIASHIDRMLEEDMLPVAWIDEEDIPY